MLSGVSLVLSEVPLELFDRHGLNRHIYDRGGELEVQFHFADAERLIPVRRSGRSEILRWGNRRGESPRLPCTAWTQLETVEGGEPVVIPATMGLEKGVWYWVRPGIRGLLIHDEERLSRVYVVCEPASHYYQKKTHGSRWMPVLIGERI
jgi:hypothetical protein